MFNIKANNASGRIIEQNFVEYNEVLKFINNLDDTYIYIVTNLDLLPDGTTSEYWTSYLLNEKEKMGQTQ